MVDAEASEDQEAATEDSVDDGAVNSDAVLIVSEEEKIPSAEDSTTLEAKETASEEDGTMEGTALVEEVKAPEDDATSAEDKTTPSEYEATGAEDNDTEYPAEVDEGATSEDETAGSEDDATTSEEDATDEAPTEVEEAPVSEENAVLEGKILDESFCTIETAN